MFLFPRIAYSNLHAVILNTPDFGDNEREWDSQREHTAVCGLERWRPRRARASRRELQETTRDAQAVTCCVAVGPPSSSCCARCVRFGPATGCGARLPVAICIRDRGRFARFRYEKPRKTRYRAAPKTTRRCATSAVTLRRGEWSSSFYLARARARSRATSRLQGSCGLAQRYRSPLVRDVHLSEKLWWVRRSNYIARARAGFSARSYSFWIYAAIHRRFLHRNLNRDTWRGNTRANPYLFRYALHYLPSYFLPRARRNNRAFSRYADSAKAERFCKNSS